MSFLRKSYKI